MPWPQLQRVLIQERIGELLRYAEAVARVVDGSTAEIQYCRQKLALPREELDPPVLLDGDGLKRMGIPPGPAYRQLLTATRDAQLLGEVHTQAETQDLAARLYAKWMVEHDRP
jgi:hypothetical protein